MVKKNSIPDRWRSLTAVGQRVPGSRFIAFKVPLKGVTNQRVTQTQKFTPKDLITAIRKQHEELGLIIDLTNTERYYTTKDLPKSVQYVKLHTAGLKIPDDATIHQFKRVAWKFLAANSDNDKLIGVHCTTGINRSGYLICRYLIDVDGWRPLLALSSFSQARGHPIEGTVYIEDIVKGAPRSNVGIDLPPTIDETRDTDSDDPRGRGQDPIQSLLELIPGNEYSDFDARDRRPLPLMRAMSDEYEEDRPFLRRLPVGDMSGDLDLRSPMERRSMPERMNAVDRFRRPVDFDPNDRFNSGLEDGRDFYGSEPRPLMDIRDPYGPRDMQRPRGMQQAQMDYDIRMGAQQSQEEEEESYDVPSEEITDVEYADADEARRMRSLSSGLAFIERLRRQELQNMENENQKFNPKAREMINSLKGLLNDKMPSRNVRPLGGPMNARNTQFLSEPMNEMLNQRRGMEGARFMEGSGNERFPPALRNLTYQQAVRAMTAPMSDRVQSRDTQFMEGPMQPKVARLMDLPLNPREEQAMGNAMNERVPQRALTRPGNEMMASRDARSMAGPMNTRMQPREGLLPLPNARPAAGLMNEQMYQRAGRPMQGSMNEQTSTYAPPMEDSMNEEMYSYETEYPINQQSDFMSDNRPFEGRKMTASEILHGGTNRFAPYPSHMKPAQPAARSMMPPQPAVRSMMPPQPAARSMMPPTPEMVRFPLRSRFT